MRKHSFTNGEFYHIFNRGVEKRNIFLDKTDFERFLKSIEEFNTIKPIGSLYENSFLKNKLGSPTTKSRLVNVVCYCLNPNHYHFILEQRSEGGISAFLQRLSGGYTRYFNIRRKRSGVLFQGKFKSVHIRSNEYLLHASVYVNLNNRAHTLERGKSISSWNEYVANINNGLCTKDIILKQFKNVSEYKDFAESSLRDILTRKKELKEFQEILLE